MRLKVERIGATIIRGTGALPGGEETERDSHRCTLQEGRTAIPHTDSQPRL